MTVNMTKTVFDHAMEQFDAAARLMKLNQNQIAMVKEPRRATEVNLPVQMDNGTIELFKAFRVQHSIIRGPAKGGIRYHPDVTLDLRLEDRFVDLVDEGIDVALRISAAQDSSLIARKICDMQHSAVAAPVYLDAHGTPKAPEDLRNHACIVDTNLQGQANWRFVDKGQTVSVHVNGPVRVNSPLSARDAAMAGLGIALLPGTSKSSVWRPST